ncbi:MAG: leucine-rich repeat domain-containing protein [Prevotella sp.]|nr:leucine-rich repeat domain-containing protein [Prevotella sp.]
MDMKKKILLSMILLALCLIQASADTYYFKIKFSDEKGNPVGNWSSYIKVAAEPDGKNDDGTTKYKYPNGLKTLLDGGTVYDEGDGNGKNIKRYSLPTKDNKVDLDRIYGIVFANGKGRGFFTPDNKQEENILEGYEFAAWTEIREHIQYLELREYKCNTYNNSGYFMNMHKVEALELPKDGMTVGDGDTDGELYFANADKLKTIYIYSTKGNNDKVEITDYITDTEVAAIPLLNRVGKKMFSNCFNLSTKYINRLIRDVTEIKDNAFYADEGNRGNFPDEADHKMAIDIPSSVKKIGSQAFYNRVKVTGLTIHGKNDGSLDIGSEAFRGCDELHDLNLDNAKITSLGTGVFGDCRSMTSKFVNDVLTNYAANGGTKIPAYLFFGCNGQDKHDGTVANKNKCSFTDLNIPAQFTEIGDGAFASTGDAVIKLKTITVNSEKAPKCLQNSGNEYAEITDKKVFDGLEPNVTTVIFENAATGWKETKNETTGFLTYMNDGSEFQRLLTKDIYSDHTAYINVPQQHAIVRLHRTLKVGWNTICLPFGVNYKYCSDWGEDYKAKQAYNASIIVNGLTHSTGVTSDNFTMGVYRGYWKQAQTFMFLHYTDFDRYPLDFCETFLVKMRPEDIAKAEKEKDDKGVHTYTFTNVDLNYRWHADGTSGNEGNWTLVKAYSAGEMLNQVKDFDGNVNSDAIPFKDKATYIDYVFKGSLVQHTGTVGDGTISTNDYFFQQTQNNTMKLYPYKTGNTYGIRGFSGWFHKKESSNAKASELSLSLFDDGSTTPIETVKVDDLNRDTSGKVYSISGVLMKNNTADLNNLSKGIYVVNGKKYVVK